MPLRVVAPRASGARAGSRVSSPCSPRRTRTRVLERRDGACHASARWLASNRLVFSDQGLFLAELVGGVETCASAFNDADACAAADHCAYYPAAGACLPDASWSLDTIRRCVIGRGSDVDPAVTAIASLVSECLARSSSEDTCAAHADGKCAWMDPSSDVDAAFCAPDVIRVASEMFGARALAALAVAQTACVAETNPGACDAATQCGWSDADSRCASDHIGTLRVSARSTTARAFLEAVDECRRGDASEDACADVGNDALGCVWGRKSASTNIIPEEYGGDGGDGSGGWWRHDANDAADERDASSCYPSYAMFASRAAPALGLGGGDGSARRFNRSSSCSRGARRRERTRRGATRRRRARCRPRAGRRAEWRRRRASSIPPRRRNVSSRRATRTRSRAVNRACEMDGDTREACAAASTAAAEAGKAFRDEDEDEDETTRTRRIPRSSARGGVLGGDVRGCVFRRRRAVRGVRQSSQEKGRGRVRSHAGMDASTSRGRSDLRVARTI